MKMKKDRIRSIAQTALISLIDLDFHTGIESMNYFSIEDYCEGVFEATREEIEEILGMNMEEISVVEHWLSKKGKDNKNENDI